ncbi:hypothetical protein EJB05_26054, partial [Eragrostis curvula]
MFCRLSLSNNKYQVIKSPIDLVECKSSVRSFLGKSEKGVYFAAIDDTDQLRVWILRLSLGAQGRTPRTYTSPGNSLRTSTPGHALPAGQEIPAWFWEHRDCLSLQAGRNVLGFLPLCMPMHQAPGGYEYMMCFGVTGKREHLVELAMDAIPSLRCPSILTGKPVLDLVQTQQDLFKINIQMNHREIKPLIYPTLHPPID